MEEYLAFFHTRTACNFLFYFSTILLNNFIFFYTCNLHQPEIFKQINVTLTKLILYGYLQRQANRSITIDIISKNLYVYIL